MPTIIWRGSVALTEQPDSPRWTFADKVTLVRVFKGPYDLCFTSRTFKGVIDTDTGLRVSQCTVEKDRGGIGTLTIEYEGAQVGQPLPADEQDLAPADQEIEIKKHPIFDGLSDELKSAVNVYIENTDHTSQSWTDAKAAVDASDLATTLYKKILKDVTHFKGPASIFTIKQSYWVYPTNLTLGGYRETPPGIAFTFADTLEWIRDSDRATWNGSQWTVESRWLGAPEWDTDLYP